MWEQSETALLLTRDQRLTAWADGRCGQCGRDYRDHPRELTPVSTADAVTLTPCPPEDCARILGQLPTLSDETLLTLERLHAAAMEALTAAAVLDPDSPLLPDMEVAR